MLKTQFSSKVDLSGFGIELFNYSHNDDDTNSTGMVWYGIYFPLKEIQVQFIIEICHLIMAALDLPYTQQVYNKVLLFSRGVQFFQKGVQGNNNY